MSFIDFLGDFLAELTRKLELVKPPITVVDVTDIRGFGPSVGVTCLESLRNSFLLELK